MLIRKFSQFLSDLVIVLVTFAYVGSNSAIKKNWAGEAPRDSFLPRRAAAEAAAREVVGGKVEETLAEDKAGQDDGRAKTRSHYIAQANLRLVFLLPAFVSRVLELQACTAMPALLLHFFKKKKKKPV